ASIHAAMYSNQFAQSRGSCACQTPWISWMMKVWSANFVAMCSADRHSVLRGLASGVLIALQNLRASYRLLSPESGNLLRDDLTRLHTPVLMRQFHLNGIKPLLRVALTDNLNDALIWNQARIAVAQPIPPPRIISCLGTQTPLLHTT